MAEKKDSRLGEDQVGLGQEADADKGGVAQGGDANGKNKKKRAGQSQNLVAETALSAWQRWLLLGATLAVVLATGVIWAVWPAGRPLLTRLAAIVGLVGVYPVAYLAYLGFGANAQRERLQDDFRLLGLVKEDDLKATVDKLYHTVYNPLQFIAYICLIVLVQLLALYGYINREALPPLPAASLALVFYASLGAYVFSVQELIRRYNTFDLQPPVYSSILARLLVAAILVFAGAGVITLGGGQLAQPAAGGEAAGDPQAWAAVLAFVIGAFPDSGLRWFRQQANRVLSPSATNASDLPLRDLLGISDWHAARLQQMGLDDAQNLAAADMRRLLLTTQFDTQQIVQWIDQAILYVKVGTKLPRCRDAGITTFHELRSALSALSQDPRLGQDGNALQAQAQARDRLAATLGLPDAEALERLADHTNFPNYTYLHEYYTRSAQVARQRAQAGMDRLLGALEETDYVEAVQAGEQLLELNAKDAALHNRVGFAYYQLSLSAEAQEKLRLEEKAYQHFNEAIHLDEHLVPPYCNRSLIYLGRGDYDAAIKDCRQALHLDRRNADAFNNRGLAYMRMNYNDLALEDLKEALRLNPRLNMAYLNRGVIYTAFGQFAEAVEDYQRAELLETRSAELWLGWGKALIGLAEQERLAVEASEAALPETAYSYYLEAIGRLSEAVTYEHVAAEAYAKRGYAYLQLGPGYYPQAQMDLETAMQRDNKRLDAGTNLGLLYARLKKYPEAMAQYEAVLKAGDPQYTLLPRFNLGIAAYEQGKKTNDEALKAKAKEQFQVIIKSYPDTVEAREAGQYLALLADTANATAPGGAGLNQEATHDQIV